MSLVILIGVTKPPFIFICTSLRLDGVKSVNIVNKNVHKHYCLMLQDEMEKLKMPAALRIEPRIPGLSCYIRSLSSDNLTTMIPSQSFVRAAQVVLNGSVTHLAATQHVHSHLYTLLYNIKHMCSSNVFQASLCVYDSNFIGYLQLFVYH